MLYIVDLADGLVFAVVRAGNGGFVVVKDHQIKLGRMGGIEFALEFLEWFNKF